MLEGDFVFFNATASSTIEENHPATSARLRTINRYGQFRNTSEDISHCTEVPPGSREVGQVDFYSLINCFNLRLLLFGKTPYPLSFLTFLRPLVDVLGSPTAAKYTHLPASSLPFLFFHYNLLHPQLCISLNRARSSWCRHHDPCRHSISFVHIYLLPNGFLRRYYCGEPG